MAGRYVDRQEKVISSTRGADGLEIQRVSETVAVRLKTCPVCKGYGHAVTVNQDDGKDYRCIECRSCGIRSGLYETLEEAAESWNARVSRRPESARVIKPCPFCGGRAAAEFCDNPDDEEGNSEWQYVVCQGCGAHTPPSADGSTAKYIWNTGHHEDH